jgi:hypothetical protein
MVTKTLELSLGSIIGDPPDYSTGWYKDSVTGQYYYYDAVSMKWYVYAAGYIYPLTVVEQSAPYAISIMAGNNVKISISYKYTGPASSGVEEYFSIGYKDILGYHPKIEGTNSRNLPICATATLFTAEKTLAIPIGVGSDWNHIECKVWHGTPDVPEMGLRYLNALTIVGLVAAVAEFTIVNYVKV